MALFDRLLFTDTREWICSRAAGDVLEVAVGTGLNLAHYPPDVRLTGIDTSPAMLDIARTRASGLSRDIDLRVGDAEHLDFPDASFDTVVCTFSLCAIPDERRAVAEMQRVLRPGRLLLLADHVSSSARLARGVQRVLEIVTVPIGGEHFLRRPRNTVQGAGMTIEQEERFKLGIVERLAARKPM
ncbi:MAG TPA: class I SAM-dependent methyltransferase [Acidothermaceae bacterium]